MRLIPDRRPVHPIPSVRRGYLPLTRAALVTGLLLGLTSVLLVIVPPALAVVTLVSFDAVPGERQVQLRWSTSSELNHAGFFVHGSTNPSPVIESGVYRLHTSIITSQDGALTGASYAFTHTNLTNGTSYYYWLESVNTQGVSEYFGPRLAVPGTTPTPGTPTRTPTTGDAYPGPATNTTGPYPGPVTATTAAPGGFQVRTNTPFPTDSTGTAGPGLGTITPLLTLTPDGTGVITTTATTTLIPLPSLTLLFPAISPTLSATSEGELILDGTIQATSQPSGSRDGLPESILAVGGLIVMIWLLLGVFLFVYIRRLGY